MSDRRQLIWKIVVVTTCFICYGLTYFTRNHLYVTTDSFKNYLDPNNENNAQKWLGIMYTFGWIGLLISKLLFSIFIDTTLKSGVKPFAFGLITVPILSIVMALVNIENNITFRILICIAIWTLLRGCIAPQWCGIMKIMSNWINYQQYGRVMSIMSLSYLIGDSFTRFVYAYILTFDIFNDNWRTVFYFGSFMTLIAVIPLLIFVKDSPIQRGLELPTENPDNAYSKSNIQPQNDSNYRSVDDGRNSIISEHSQYEIVQNGIKNTKLWPLLQPLMIEPMFYFIILLHFELTFLREFFNMYSVSYLQSIGASNSYYFR